MTTTTKARPVGIHIRPSVATAAQLQEAQRVLAERAGGVAISVNRVANRALDIGLRVLIGADEHVNGGEAQ